MTTSSSERPWVLRGIAIVAMFVFLNHVFGTGSIRGLLDASWGQPLTWAGVLLGLLASVFLVEAFRRADWQNPRWFVEVFGIIGAYVVLEDLAGNLFGPAVDPLVDPVFDSMPVWTLPVVLMIFLAAGALAISRLIERYWGEKGATEEG